MKFDPSRLMRTCMLVCWALLLLSVSHAQAASGNRVFFVGSDQRIYMADPGQGIAAPLPITVRGKTSLAISPDRQYLAVVGENGIAVHKISGSTTQKIAQITGAAVANADWSSDSKALVYIQETKNPDGSTAVQIHLWDRETRQTKRLL